MLGTSKSVWGFDPRSVPGCQLWLDGADPAATGVTPSNGATVSTWVDKSGNGRNGIQYSSFASPTFLTNSLNSRGGISFSAASSNCYQTATILPTPRALFVVGFSSNDGFILSGIPTPNSGHPPYYATFARDVEYGVNNTSDQALLANVASTANVNYILTGLYTGSNVTAIMNGGTLSNTVAFSGTPKTPATTLIGINSYNGSLGAPLTGTINEFIAFNTDLTTTQRQQIEGYLAHKWGLTTSVPSTHPFKSIRPHLRTFQPSDIPGCQLWLDAADSSTLVLSGSNVTQWSDKSGSINHFTPTSGTPTSISDNGRNVVNFTSGAIMTSTNQITFTTSSAFFIVSKITGVVNWGNMLVGFTNIGGGDFSIRFEDFILRGTRGTGNGNDFANGTYYVNGNFNPSFVSDVYLNVYSMIGTVSPQAGGTSSVTLSSGFMGRNFIGNIAEFLYYPGGVTTSQRQQVEGYLAHKWGLTTPIPSTHPFKSFPPAKAPMIIGLVNRWIFNNGSGSTVTDTVGGQNISLSGTYTWSSSVPNSEIALGSLSFNGYSGTGSASVNATLQTSTYTMTLWYYHTGVSDPYGGNPMILQSGFNQNEAFSFATGGFTGTSKPYFYSGVYNGGFFRSFSSATPLNTWTHLAVTIGNSTYNAYQNGVLDSGNTNISITSGLPLTLNGSFIFAKGDSAYGNRFGGSLFDVRIYNRALSASEISQIYNGIG